MSENVSIILSTYNEKLSIEFTISELVVKLVSKTVLVSVIVNVPDVLVNCVPLCIVKSENLELKNILLESLVPK